LFLIFFVFIFADKTYTVKKGDTLSGIASKYGVTVLELQKWNSTFAMSEYTTMND